MTSDINSVVKLKKEIEITPSFHDVDAMGVVWHGNYLKFFEKAREALFKELDFGYSRMKDSGYIWPIIEVRVTYRKPATLESTIIVSAEIKEYENEIRIEYQVKDKKTNQLLTCALTRQMAFDLKKQQGCLISPPILFKILGKEPPYA